MHNIRSVKVGSIVVTLKTWAISLYFFSCVYGTYVIAMSKAGEKQLQSGRLLVLTN